MNPQERLPSPRPGLLNAARSLLIGGAVVMTPWIAVADEPSNQDVFGEQVDVRVVNLEVVVTDGGQRVQGLKPDDFVLMVDGREVPISFFTEVADGTAVQALSAAQSGSPALTQGEAVATSYLVFVDEFFTEKIDRDRTLRALIDQLPSLSVTDQMAVVAYDGQHVEMVNDWTGNADTLAATFTSMLDRPAHGLEWRLEERNFENDRIQRARDADFLAQSGRVESQLSGSLNPLRVGLTVEERQFASRIEEATQRAVDSAAAAIRGFAQPEGRKVLLLLSGGWPSEASRWVVPDPDRAEDRAHLMAGDRLLRPLMDTANLLGYSVYPVDMPGIDANTTDVAARSVTEQELLRKNAQYREDEEELSLLALAHETGGQAFLDAGSLKALARTADDTRNYYWLGFSPTWQEDDSRRKVRVKVREKGLKVRSRRSFSDLSQSSKVTMLTEGTLLFRDSPDMRPLTASFGAGEKAGFGRQLVPLTIDIPVDEVTFLPTADGFQADLELRLAVIDKNGNRAEIPITPITYKTERLPGAAEVATYETRVRMRKRRHDVVVSLYDRLSGRVHSTRLTVADL